MPFRLVAALFFAALCAMPASAVTAEQPSIKVWKSATCGCCVKWVEHLEANGFSVKVHNATPTTLDRIKRQSGIEEKLASCHTAKINGYVIEGHVPASDITRLLADRPDALGLSVPGMPLGSPGMEQPGGETEPFDVLLVKKDGTLDIFARH